MGTAGIVIGWVVWALAAGFTLAWTYSCRLSARSGQLLADTAALKSYVVYTPVFWIIILFFLFSPANKLHILWLLPAAWITGPIYGFLVQVPGLILVRLILLGVDRESSFVVPQIHPSRAIAGARGIVKDSAEAAFFEVVEAGNMEKVRAILRADPGKINARDASGGDSPLHRAARGGHEDVAEFLLGHGAEVNARDNEAGTPLHDAAYRGHKGIAESLLAHGAEVNKWDVSGRTPLYWAAQRGHNGVAEVLLSGGAGVDLKDKHGVTPLHCAVATRHSDLAELLLANGADVNAPDEKGRTPLHWATHDGDNDIAQLLLARGAYVDAKDNEGRTPLHDVAWAGYKDTTEWFKDTAELLLAASADVNAKDNEGRTPLDLANKVRQRNIAAFLRRHGGKRGEEMG